MGRGLERGLGADFESRTEQTICCCSPEAHDVEDSGLATSLVRCLLKLHERKVSCITALCSSWEGSVRRIHLPQHASGTDQNGK